MAGVPGGAAGKAAGGWKEASSTLGQVKNLPPRRGGMDGAGIGGSSTSVGISPSQGQHHHDAPRRKSPRRRLLPARRRRWKEASSTLGQVKNLPPRRGGMDGAGIGGSSTRVGISPSQGQHHHDAPRRKSPRRRLLPARRRRGKRRWKEASSTLGQVKNLPPRRGGESGWLFLPCFLSGKVTCDHEAAAERCGHLCAGIQHGRIRVVIPAGRPEDDEIGGTAR